jgi:kynurenine formamidase
MKQLLAVAALFLVTACTAAPPPPPPATETAAPPPAAAAAAVFDGIATGKTRLIDLGHALNPQNPHWPGPGYSPFKYEIFATLEKDGVLSGRFTMAEHTGTHLDAPNHFAAGQIPVDKIPLDQLFAPAAVIDVRESVAKNADYQLTPDDIRVWEEAHGRIKTNSVVMMYTGWDTRWTDFETYKNADRSGTLHFPGFSPEATKLLVDERNVAGIGIDTLSVDYGMSKDFAVHHISHGKGKYHLENVANLGTMPPSGAWLIVAPMKIENGTGGPARIFALVVGSTS